MCIYLKSAENNYIAEICYYYCLCFGEYFWFIKSNIINVIIAIWLRIVCTINIVIQSLDNNWYLSVVKEINYKLFLLSILNLSHTILVIVLTSLTDVKPKKNVNLFR